MATKNQEPNERLNVALQEANSAIKEMGGSAKVALAEDYDQVKEALRSTHLADAIVSVKDKSAERVKQLGQQLDDNVHEKPYHYIAAAAVTGVLIGIAIGRR